MALAKQKDSFPTNKLAVAALIGPATTEAWGAIFATVYAPISGPEVSLLAGAVATLVVGWFVPDRAQA